LPSKAGGDEAAESPAARIPVTPMEKGVLSSPENDSSIYEFPCGDGRTILVELVLLSGDTVACFLVLFLGNTFGCFLVLLSGDTFGCFYCSLVNHLLPSTVLW